ncbi:MAG: PEGA domain-containing protein [Methanospirillum sp.]|uniref:PEGA domain-containing protein n=1 Tax=Methanospirillum sp. TaxID=45200 RepID=UPI0023695E88|nr:PEGA domain-containing protein [Methanospirillum sp.]MDD1729419.1 PEGA domain-containing protein [Methanospirillum sp.]
MNKSGMLLLISLIIMTGYAVSGLVSQNQTEPEYGVVQLNAMPGIQVVFDNHPGGVLPESGTIMIENVTAGHHQFLASKTGYKPEYFETDVTSNETAFIQVNLTEQVPAYLEISSIPTNVKVFVNEQYQGITPITIPEFIEGTNIVKLELENYQDWQQEIPITNGENKTILATLVPISPTSKTPGFCLLTAFASLLCMGIWFMRKVR